MAVDYSVIIPAYNEARYLPDTLKALKAAMACCRLNGEIIVTDNNSTDATASVAADAGATVIFESHNQISRARNAGARHAQGRYLLFVDADTAVSPELLSTAMDNLVSDACCGGGAVVKFDTEISRAAKFGLAAWTWLSTYGRLASGCFIYCWRSDFEDVGGFSESVYASEELWLSRRLRARGKKRDLPFCIITRYPAVSSGRKLQWYGIWSQIGLLLTLLLLPFLVRYRRFCGFWYNRPQPK